MILLAANPRRGIIFWVERVNQLDELVVDEDGFLHRIILHQLYVRFVSWRGEINSHTLADSHTLLFRIVGFALKRNIASAFATAEAFFILLHLT